MWDCIRHTDGQKVPAGTVWGQFMKNAANFTHLLRYIKRSGIYPCNLKLYTLTEVGRLEDALRFIKTDLLSSYTEELEEEEGRGGKPRNRRKKVVCYEVMERLARYFLLRMECRHFVDSVVIV